MTKPSRKVVFSNEARVDARAFRPWGSNLELWKSTAPEVVLSGPAGTGKSRAALEKVYHVISKYPEARVLIVRKTRASLTESALTTFENYVIPPNHPMKEGASKANRRSYVYQHANGKKSEVVLGGMDYPSRIMSTEFDMIYVQEAIELSIEEWESLATRLRNYKMPYQQLMGDTNPDAPGHWLYQRHMEGKVQFIYCRHEDNPVLFKNETGTWTELGKDYLSKLDNLTGARKQRLRYGKWVQAEGVVYTEWNPNVHWVNRFDIPSEWKRVWVVDFGYVNPFVWQAWAINPENNKGYLYKEVYETKRLVAEIADEIVQYTRGEPAPDYVICDHDAENRQVFTEITGFNTMPAYKDVKVGINAVQEALKGTPDKGPDIYIFRDSLIREDPLLVESHKPLCTAQEFDSYVWDLKTAKREEPRKENDHGMDALRYFVVQLKGLAVREGKFF